MASPLERLHHGDYQTTHPHRLPQLQSIPQPLRKFVVQADLNHEHGVAAVAWAGIGPVLAIGAGLVFGLWYGIVVATTLIVVPLVLAARWSGRRTRQLVSALPDAVEMVGRSLRSGASFTQALHEVAAEAPRVFATEIQQVLDGIEMGQPGWQALRAWADEVGRPEVRIVASALALASENEAGSSRALEGVSQSLRDRSALAAEIRSHTAQAAVSMQALVLLPLGFLSIESLGDQRTIRYLTSERLGQLCLVIGVVLNIVGWAWMKSIVHRRLPS
jgi:tight adherence protein B